MKFKNLVGASVAAALAVTPISIHAAAQPAAEQEQQAARDVGFGVEIYVATIFILAVIGIFLLSEEEEDDRVTP